ncbi:hypothetical protein QBA57_17435 [Streptomyces scabiei]|uniref:hypothetical protein n=1 Tax=Streptomyces scabiei TaxID=1930 RepID=UPI000765CA00|nr:MULTISPECIES: hypothetical protein [Streptomyces]MBP5862125.1 hypothetical protein [Streptomyces sp. LBUM 1484]MBP5877417.1 hypothetical protein [Streptomyces sp. LBUM 1477]MBP5885247.1 hypothetical protein [Streptomyces sp. LBUM 1487]MBP5901218.1 hypothetical protein [Streptomyces sp. LBUM 1488]MDW8474749.1 hypothetical protein [Streptomyces scabiei]
MPLLDDEVSASVVQLLGENGFTRLLAVPSFPAGSPEGFHYPLRTEMSDGSEWYLRSWGTDFRTVSRAWLRGGLTAAFSLGWAVLPEGQTDRLLIIEAFGTDGSATDALRKRALGLVEPYACRSAVAESEQWGRVRLRIAALLRSEMNRNSDGSAPGDQ